MIATGFLALPSAAAAQDNTKMQLGASYAILHLSDEGFTSTSPVGWLASFSGRVNNTVAIVGDIAGHYKFGGDIADTSAKAHTFMGGARVMFRGNPQATPWVQGQAGVLHESDDFSSENDGAIDIGAGVDFHLSNVKRLGFRVQFDWLGIHSKASDTQDESNWINGARFAFGVVLPLGAK